MATNKRTQVATAESTPSADTFRGYNRVKLAGRLVADPEIRYTTTGKAVCTLRLATNDTRDAQFHDVVAWEQVAETAGTLTKGSAIAVSGRLQTRSWEAADGSRRRTTEIIAAHVGPFAAADE
jgi:single-strand DNA-binding protein